MGATSKPELKSTVKGLKYPSGRDGGLRSPQQWLEGKRCDDGAEGLWRIGDKLYDLNAWAKRHPGGAEWIDLTRGTDVTEAFEVHHLLPTAELMLPKFYVRDAVSSRSSPFTFAPDGFYRKFKERARVALKDVDIHESAAFTNLVADALCASTFFFCLLSAVTRSWLFILASAVSLTWLANAGHNFMHKRNSFRMLYMDLGLQSSMEWRISHALSHHIYTNTVLDLEISMFEPFLNWLTIKDKTVVATLLFLLFTPVVCTVAFVAKVLKRWISIVVESAPTDLRDVVPFVIPVAMCLVAPPSVAFWTWFEIITATSGIFVLIGISAAHHHPDIFHDGDVHREDMDFGLAQLDAVRDRVDIDETVFLTITHYGQHTLHHLLPTIDHAYLNLVVPAFQKTCEEFNVDSTAWNQWKLFKGQFAQQIKASGKITPNVRPNSYESESRPR